MTASSKLAEASEAHVKLLLATWFNSHLHSLVEDAAADLHHLQVLLLFIPCALDVGHPAALILLTGVDEITHRAVFIEHLSAHEKENSIKSQECVNITISCPSYICHTHRALQASPAADFRNVCASAYLPHEVVILEQVHVFGRQDSPSERAHLGSCFDPGF